MSCIASGILLPGQTMMFGRDMKESGNIDRRYWKSMPLGFLKRMMRILPLSELSQAHKRPSRAQ